MNDKLAFLISLATLSLTLVTAFILYGPESTKRKRRQVAGLENLGNTCYMNTVVQSLAACGKFLRWLEQSHFQENCQLSLTLSKILKAVNNNQVAAVHSPQRLLDVLHECNWWRGGQQDAHELFQFIISQLASDQQHIISLISVFQPSLLHTEDKNDVVSNMKSRFEFKFTNISNHIHPPFRGLIANHLTCTVCKNKKPISLTTFDTLTLPIPTRTYNIVTLEFLLQAFTQSEFVQDVTCLKCSGKMRIRENESHCNLPDVTTLFTKQMILSKIPKCLCIHIQRVSWQTSGVPQRKDNYVKFPELLNVRDFCESNIKRKNSKNQQIAKAIKTEVKFIGSTILPNHRLHYSSLTFRAFEDRKCLRLADAETCMRTSSQYKLMAAIVHVGDAYSGHFVTYRRAPPVNEESSKDWLCISDGSVTKTTVSEVLAQKAYMLFYQQEPS